MAEQTSCDDAPQRGAAVADNATLGSEVVLADGCVVEHHAVLGDRVQLGRNVHVMAGAYLGAGSLLGADVVVAPNAALVSSEQVPGVDTGIVVRDGASIGANATVLGGVTIGAGAVVGPGAVVSRDVPPFAIVTGSPALISGHVPTSVPTSSLKLRASTLADADLPLRLGPASLIGMPVITDMRGSLTFAEVGDRLPFAAERFFMVYDVPSREVRGEHAHRELQEFLVCVRGEVSVTADDGTNRGEVVLDRPNVGLHLPAMSWTSQYGFSDDAILLVLASDPYDDADYIRSYDDFLLAANGG